MHRVYCSYSTTRERSHIIKTLIAEGYTYSNVYRFNANNYYATLYSISRTVAPIDMLLINYILNNGVI